MGEPPNPEILGPRKATHPSQTRGGGGRGKWRKRSTPPRGLGTPPGPSPHHPAEWAAGKTGNPPCTLSPGSSRVLPQHP
ncbi:hypothetical protein EI555_015491 [Monodon monoceros]|uniref:Uncharacterized protein n=1 Tax=Monodon monoceros TaxID=40151 RepID=A0A4U1EH09_MONMO|nr:hypothetical protein EI555_015491 [Monodon monoceros]